MSKSTLRLKVSHRLATPKYYDFFNKFTLVLKHDAIASAFSFDFRFDPENQEHAELFAVSHFHEAIIEHNNKTLVTGFILSQKFKHSAKKHLSSIGGYSKTGVLEDCEIPPSLYPLQIDGLSIKQIAEKLCTPFRLNVIVDDAISDKMNAKVKSTTSKETDNIKNVLAKLCLQRKILMTHNELGDLVFTSFKTNAKPLFEVIEGTLGTELDLMFNGQGLHSDITVIKEASSSGGNAGQYTIENPFVPVAYTYRPKTITQSSGEDTTTQEFAMQVLKTELKNAIVLTIRTDRWEVNGEIIKPNNTVTVLAPELFIYHKTDFFIEEITFEGDESKTTAVLKCVLPCCYDDTTPVNIFVNPHENFPRYNYSINNGNKSTFKI